MILLAGRFDPAAAPPAGTRARGLLVQAGPAAASAAAAWALERWGPGPAEAWRAVGSAAVHLAFIAAARALAADGGSPSICPLARLGVVLLVASLGARWSPWGGFLFLGIPVMLLREARESPALRAIGVSLPRPPLALLAGLAVGAFLGLHVLVSASLTLGYAVGIRSPGAYLAALFYDAGANAVSAECLFRGALFTRWWRRRAFWPAAAASTGLAVLRYLCDPALPRTLEVAAGAVFYMTLLGLAACALRAASGSLLPGYAATVSVFAAYRLLGS